MDPRIEHLVDPQDQNISTFTFWLNETLYALSIKNVLSICQDSEPVSTVPCDVPGLIGVVRYQNQPVTLYDFAHRVGVQSGREIKEQVSSELIRFESEFDHWFQAVEESIFRDKPFTGLKDSGQTSFGKWLRSFSTRDESLTEVLEHLEQLYQEVFAAADVALTLRLKGEETAKRMIEETKVTTYHKARQAFQQARQLLAELARPVVLYVTQKDNEVAFALRIDEVNNIITFAPEEFRPAGSEQELVLGFLCKESEPDCLLINIESFCRDSVLMQ